jgi:hypothetical protein
MAMLSPEPSPRRNVYVQSQSTERGGGQPPPPSEQQNNSIKSWHNALKKLTRLALLLPLMAFLLILLPPESSGDIKFGPITISSIAGLRGLSPSQRRCSLSSLHATQADFWLCTA